MRGVYTVAVVIIEHLQVKKMTAKGTGLEVYGYVLPWMVALSCVALLELRTF
jgi:hypothetical protein